jgi:hypothetical protein
VLRQKRARVAGAAATVAAAVAGNAAGAGNVLRQ